MGFEVPWFVYFEHAGPYRLHDSYSSCRFPYHSIFNGLGNLIPVFFNPTA